jgi:hypothetical protein
MHHKSNIISTLTKKEREREREREREKEKERKRKRKRKKKLSFKVGSQRRVRKYTSFFQVLDTSFYKKWIL